MEYDSYRNYIYDGPVVLYDKCVCHRYIMSTRAPSESKARSNLIYRYKKENGLPTNAKVTLPGKLEIRY